MFDNFKIEDLGKDCSEPISGIESEILYAHPSYIESMTFPKDLCGTGDTVAKTLEELVQVSEIKFKEGKGFHKLDMIQETGSIKNTMIGERKRRLFQNSLPVKIAGSNAKLLGFCRMIKNADLIVIVRELDSGQCRLFGNTKSPAWIEAMEHTIEELQEGANELDLTVNDKMKWPAAVFTGDVTLYPETTSKD